MPLDISDAPPIIIDTLQALDEIRKSLRKKSKGGKVITPEEREAIGHRLKDLGETFLREALD